MSSDLNDIAKNSNGDVDLEHLQLALAMSNSLQDSQIQQNTESSFPSTQQKIESLKETLRQFGFNSAGSTSKSSQQKVRWSLSKYLK